MMVFRWIYQQHRITSTYIRCNSPSVFLPRSNNCSTATIGNDNWWTTSGTISSNRLLSSSTSIIDRQHVQLLYNCHNSNSTCTSSRGNTQQLAYQSLQQHMLVTTTPTTTRRTYVTSGDLYNPFSNDNANETVTVKKSITSSSTPFFKELIGTVKSCPNEKVVPQDHATFHNNHRLHEQQKKFQQKHNQCNVQKDQKQTEKEVGLSVRSNHGMPLMMENETLSSSSSSPSRTSSSSLRATPITTTKTPLLLRLQLLSSTPSSSTTSRLLSISSSPVSQTLSTVSGLLTNIKTTIQTKSTTQLSSTILHQWTQNNNCGGGVRFFASKKHKNLLKFAKGYRGRAKNCFRVAIRRVEKAWQYGYRDRKVKHRLWRRLWIMRIQAGIRQYGYNYSTFMKFFGDKSSKNSNQTDNNNNNNNRNKNNPNIHRSSNNNGRIQFLLNRKVLAELAANEPLSFKSVVDVVFLHQNSNNVKSDQDTAISASEDEEGGVDAGGEIQPSAA